MLALFSVAESASFLADYGRISQKIGRS